VAKKELEVYFDPEIDDPLEAMVILPSKPDLRAANRRVHQELDGDPLGLDEIFQAAIDKREWEVVGVVALIHIQQCNACGATQRFSHGWKTEKRHLRDKTCRVLEAGLPVEESRHVARYPAKVEYVQCPSVDVCADCAETQIMIDNASRGVK
jgi:hypothetical protein